MALDNKRAFSFQGEFYFKKKVKILFSLNLSTLKTGGETRS